MAGTGKFCVSLSVSKKDPDRARAALSVANAAVRSDHETVVFLSDDGVLKGASLVGPEGLVEFLSDGTPCVSY